MEDENIDILPWEDMKFEGERYTGSVKLVDGKKLPHGFGRIIGMNFIKEGQLNNGKFHGYWRGVLGSFHRENISNQGSLVSYKSTDL